MTEMIGSYEEPTEPTPSDRLITASQVRRPSSSRPVDEAAPYPHGTYYGRHTVPSPQPGESPGGGESRGSPSAKLDGARVDPHSAHPIQGVSSDGLRFCHIGTRSGVDSDLASVGRGSSLHGDGELISEEVYGRFINSNSNELSSYIASMVISQSDKDCDRSDFARGSAFQGSGNEQVLDVPGLRSSSVGVWGGREGNYS
jgi:hypothetical protein